MSERFRRLLSRMSSDGREIPNPVSDFCEKWKHVPFDNPTYARLVYRVYNYLNNPLLNLHVMFFDDNAATTTAALREALMLARREIDASLLGKRSTSPGDVKIVWFVNELLAL